MERKEIGTYSSGPARVTPNMPTSVEVSAEDLVRKPPKQTGRARFVFLSRLARKKNLDFALRLLAETEGEGISVPLSPGMEGWPAEEGQPELFALLPADLVGVRLTECGVMMPAKSLTLVLGLGPEVDAEVTRTGRHACEVSVEDIEVQQ